MGMIDLNELHKVLREMFDAGRQYGWEEAKYDEQGIAPTYQTSEEAFFYAVMGLKTTKE
jgi:hypothetical protein